MRRIVIAGVSSFCGSNHSSLPKYLSPFPPLPFKRSPTPTEAAICAAVASGTAVGPVLFDRATFRRFSFGRWVEAMQAMEAHHRDSVLTRLARA